MTNTANPHELVSALVLCGGRSVRMATDKSQLRLGESTFLERICDSLRPVVSTMAIVGRANQFATSANFAGNLAISNSEPAIAAAPMPGLESVRFLKDRNPDRGPLEALATGLEYLAGLGSTRAFVTTCDTPLLKGEIVRFLFERIDEYDAVMPTDGKHVYGITAAYRTGMFREMRRLLDTGVRKVIDLPKYFRVRLISLDEFRAIDPTLDCFENINTPEDYARLLDRFGERRPGWLAERLG